MSRKQQEIIEKHGGKPLPVILKETYANSASQKEAAEKLGISQGTLSLWLKDCGLKVKVERSIGYVTTEKAQNALKDARYALSDVVGPVDSNAEDK